MICAASFIQDIIFPLHQGLAKSTVGFIEKGILA